ncbi:ATP-binding protein [Streptomyces albidoflavus]|uniref:ATP-binding protein n=1 Tax=Streptomyces albidoflavus TaxID=1886 RepID=UPI0030916270|nr:ATP-binding protein [Streptomyces albidoflavus]
MGIPQPQLPALSFRVQLSSTRRGARLARLLAVQQLDDWEIPRDGRTATTVAAVVAEFAANAATHGRTPGRDFALRLTLTSESVRIEVTDTRPDRLPTAPGRVPEMPGAAEESGRGLLLVEALADRWGTGLRNSHTKTLWAEVDRSLRHG